MRLLAKLAGSGLVAVMVVTAGLGGAIATGVVGTPTVTGVDNDWGAITSDTTEIETQIHVSNPNPIALPGGSLGVAYAVSMNDVEMANGSKRGFEVEPGNNTLALTTRIDNRNIPRWWVSHINNGERTTLTIDASVRTELPVGNVAVPVPAQQRTFGTDVLASLSSDEERRMTASGQTVLVVERTEAEWGTATLERTPVRVRATVRNPNPVPVAVPKTGYTIEMNGITVADGETEENIVILPGETKTIETTAVIDTRTLDRWWVSHLENGETTTVVFDFYAVVEYGGQRQTVPMVGLSNSDTIETDILGRD